MKFKGQNYTEVKDRIDAFLSEYPEATIETKLISVNNIVDSPTGEMCNEYLIQAIVYPFKKDNPDLYYTGHAAERDNTGFVNKTSALENGETSAVGRALAFAGYGGGYAIASKEEVDNAKAAQQKSHVTTKMLEELDSTFRKVESLLDEPMRKKYHEQRGAGYFDTKIRVNATMKFFEQKLEEGNSGK